MLYKCTIDTKLPNNPILPMMHDLGPRRCTREGAGDCAPGMGESDQSRENNMKIIAS
jgi:hypothetical protein